MHSEDYLNSLGMKTFSEQLPWHTFSVVLRGVVLMHNSQTTQTFVLDGLRYV